MWERYLQRQQREEERQRRGQQRGRGSSSPSRGRRGTGERSPDRSASPSRSGSPRRRNGERPRRRQGSIRERSSSSSSSRGSGGAEGGLATRRKRRRSHSPARSDQAWRTAERDGQGEQASGPMAAAGARDDSLGGHVSDDDIAAMIASKRSRCAGGAERVGLVALEWAARHAGHATCCGFRSMPAQLLCRLMCNLLSPSCLLAAFSRPCPGPPCSGLLPTYVPNAFLLCTGAAVAPAHAPRCQALTSLPERRPAGSLRMKTPSLCDGSS